MGKYFTTVDVASAAGVHPNTVRLYEKWKFLPQIPRAKNGYRLYTQAHIDQMLLARLALPGPYPGGGKPVYELVKQSALGNFNKALELSKQYLANVIKERKGALEAVEVLNKWSRTGNTGTMNAAGGTCSRIQAAVKLHVTVDTLRTWERNGLVIIPKNDKGQCVYSGRELLRLTIIRTLRHAGYSIMSILRMLRQFDAGRKQNLIEILNTPAPDDDIIYVTDRWLSTISEHEDRAKEIIEWIKKNIHK